jgi:hypothetical protein
VSPAPIFDHVAGGGAGTVVERQPWAGASRTASGRQTRGDWVIGTTSCGID